jgi:short-subunit dehydrogenase
LHTACRRRPDAPCGFRGELSQSKEKRHDETHGRQRGLSRDQSNDTTPSQQEIDMSTRPTILITGASSGIGATYAERFAQRGHDLVLVARDNVRLEALAARLRGQHDVAIDVVPADLTEQAGLAAVEARLRDDGRIGTLINNAGMAQSGGFLQQDAGSIARLIALNTTAPTRLAAAVAPRFAQSGGGAIVNIGSVVGFAPELGMSIYGATKAFVLFLSQGLSLELSPKGVYVQAVLPAATRTEIWERAGIDVNALPEVMEVGELVDAALAGFDRRELVTIPPLQVATRWDALESARQGLLSDIRQSQVAARYRPQA